MIKQQSSLNDWVEWNSLSDVSPEQSNSDYAVRTYLRDGSRLYAGSRGVMIPNGTQVDIRAQAMDGSLRERCFVLLILPMFLMVQQATGAPQRQ